MLQTLAELAKRYEPLGYLFSTLFLWPLLSGLANHFLHTDTPEKWEQKALKNPLGALLVELLRAFGTNGRKSVELFQRYAQRKAGVIPDTARIAQLPPILRDALKSPETVAILQQLAQELASRGGTSEPAPPGPAKEASDRPKE